MCLISTHNSHIPALTSKHNVHHHHTNVSLINHDDDSDYLYRDEADERWDLDDEFWMEETDRSKREEEDEKDFGRGISTSLAVVRDSAHPMQLKIPSERRVGFSNARGKGISLPLGARVRHTMPRYSCQMAEIRYLFYLPIELEPRG